MLSLMELQRVARVLHATRVGARLDRVVQPDAEELVLHLSGGRELPAGDRLLLLISCRPGTARVSQLAKPRQAPSGPLALAQYLRAHLENARLRSVEADPADRLLRLGFDTRTEKHALILSILGPRSNVYALDREGRLRASSRPLEDTRRELRLGDPWLAPEGRPPSAGEDRFEGKDDADLLAAIEAHYANQEARADEAQLGRRLNQVLRKQRASLERKQRLLEKDVAVGDEAPGLERLGELLKGNLREVRPGADSIQVRDFESGEPQEIPLDPKLSPAENLKALFRRARKAAKRGLRAAQDLEGARERLAAIDALAARREAAGEDAAALQELAEDPEIARLLDRYFPAPRESAPTARKKVWKLGKRELPARLVPKRYRTAEGLEVWVGRSDEGNDLLTTRLARGNDLFLHLEGSPGSHVVLRTEGGAEPPQEALLDAAELAVQFSKQKNTSRAAVHVARIKDVSKPSGTKPGLVYVHRGRTLQLRRDPARLKRITASRIED